jgi:hypothetical protein
MRDEGLNRNIESEETRNIEQQSLEDVTVNPRESVEQTGDYKEAEIIQTTLINLVETVSPEGDLEPDTQLISSTLQAAEALPQAVVRQGTPEIIVDPVEVQAEPKQMINVEGEEGDADFRRLEEVRTVKQERPTEEERETTTHDAVRGARAMDEEQEPAVENSQEVVPSIDGEVVEPGEAIEPEMGDVGEQGEGEEPEAIGEEEELWIPPEMYVYIGADGKSIVVDADGKPLDCPPMIKVIMDGGKEVYIAYFTFTAPSESFELQAYNPPIENMYVYTRPDGTRVVVDANGKPLDCPPMINVIIDTGGEVYGARYSYSDEIVELQAYNPPIENMFVYNRPDGTRVVVDVNGKPVYCPPKLTTSDFVTYYASYWENEPVELQYYKAPIDSLYIYDDGSGKVPIVVDEDGKPVDCPPNLTTSDSISFYANYWGDEPVEIQYFKAPIDSLYIYDDGSGKVPIVVDEDGKPVDCPPNLTTSDSISFYANYWGDEPVEIQYFKAPIDSLYIYDDGSGKVPIVVDENGTPVGSPPKLTTSDSVTFYASYWGDEPVEIQYYKPKSAPQPADDV